MKYRTTLGALALAVGLVSTAHAADFVEGKDYKVLPNPETIAGDVVVVREFFWYGCPHCYTLEPHMQKCAKKSIVFFYD